MSRLISLFIVFLYLGPGDGWAQPLYKASLPVVDTTDFYRIDLPYDVLGASRPDLADIRIKDEKGSDVAWLLRKASFPEQMLLDIPLKKSEIRTDGKYTDIKLSFPFKIRVSELVFYISAPQYYKRNIKLSPSYAIGTLIASEGKPLTVLCNQYTDSLVVSVNNGDDRALAIDSIKAYTPKYYLIACLERGMRYSMTYGDAEASFPEYDLSFGIYVSDSIARLIPGNIEKLSVAQPVELPQWLSFLKTYGIWAVIILIILQILYVVRKLTR